MSYMRSVVGRNVVMRRILVRICWSVTRVDTRTLKKMAVQWSRILCTACGKCAEIQLCTLTGLVLMSL